MKLQILVPRYNEPDNVIQNLLKSLDVQQGVDFDNFEVLIGDDGSNLLLSDDILNSHPYSIQYKRYDHSGPAGTRQHLFDDSSAEYIMYCDADDMFLSVLGLYTIFSYIHKGFDALITGFMEEVKDTKTCVLLYYKHSSDLKFVHGKVYRRRHLIDNKISWNTKLLVHEDATYNFLAISTAKIKETCEVPIYLWKWRDDSICRADPLYVLKTYNEMIAANIQLVEDLLTRNLYDSAKFQVGQLVYNTYFAMNKSIWLDPMHAKYRYETEKCFKRYFKKHKKLFEMINPEMKTRLISGIKHRVLREGILLEQFTFDEWIEHIEELD